MVVCVGCPVLLLEMRRDWLPLRPGTTAAYFLRNFEWDAALYLRTVDADGNLPGFAPFYFIRPCDLEDPSRCGGCRCLLLKPGAERASGL